MKFCRTNPDTKLSNNIDILYEMNFKALTIPQLKRECKSRGIKGYSGKKKEDIIQLLNTNTLLVDQCPYVKLTVKQLLLECKRVGIKGTSGKKKAEIIQMIKCGPTNECGSKNAKTARSGNLAEKLLCESVEIWKLLSTQYFNKKITSCEKLGPRVKSDLRITFEDKTQTLVQIKASTGNKSWAWSFDRRPVDKLPITDDAKELLRSVCLRTNTVRKEVPMDKDLIRSLLLGADFTTATQHFIHVNVCDEKITYISICSAEEFLQHICSTSYATYLPKKTCVHLATGIYLQRKGGGKTDYSPNDIQAKLTKMPPHMKVIKLNSSKTTV